MTDAPAFPSVAKQSLTPDPLLDDLRRRASVVRIRAPYGGECWLVTRYDDVRAVQTDPRFSRQAMVGKDVARTAPYPLQGGSIVEMDPPEHTRVRRIVSKAFTAKRVEAMRPRAQELVDALLEDVMKAGKEGAAVDLVDRLCMPLPIAMICELLGVPFEDRSRFGAWARVFMSSSAHTAEEIIEAHAHLMEYLAELVAARRAHPTDDLLAALVLARDAGDALTEGELVNLGFSLLVGGFETTAAQMGKFILFLLLHPAELALLRDRPELTPAAVEELLRLVNLAAGTSLAWVATADVELGGITIHAGEAVMASSAAANLDESVFDEPRRFDIIRDPNPHVAFGHGAHFCIGAHLARMELQVAIGTLVTRFPELRLAVSADDVPWRAGSAVWGLEHLPVLLG
jgi:cytochrome P450